ncbi:FAD:protein FMN transferase [soil metagenome]
MVKASVAIMGFALAAGWNGLNYSPAKRFVYSQVHMGVKVDITLYAESDAQAERAATAAFDRFEELDQIFSDYRRSSELNALIAHAGQGPQRVSPDMYRVLQRAAEVSRLSGGTFDVTAKPLIDLWRTSRKTGELPFHSEVVAAKKLVGWQNVVLGDGTANLTVAGMKLDMGGIAKGYACDAALEQLSKFGVRSALVEAGGDLAASGPPPGTSGWVVSVRNWKTNIVLKNGAISTSGDTEQWVDIGGRRFSHIVDPRTGYGLTSQIQVTIQARYGFVSDPVSKAISILPESKWGPILDHFGAKATKIKD